jgi:uncharacterized protein YjiS (DUF1127 family)
MLQRSLSCQSAAGEQGLPVASGAFVMRSAPFNHDLTLSGRPTLALLLQPAIIGEYLYRLWRTYRERQRLADLEPRLLRDIGIDPLAAAY